MLNQRVKWNPGYGNDWTGTIVKVSGSVVLVRWDDGQELWQDLIELS